jgi:hypothetical protein
MGENLLLISDDDGSRTAPARQWREELAGLG